MPTETATWRVDYLSPQTAVTVGFEQLSWNRFPESLSLTSVCALPSLSLPLALALCVCLSLSLSLFLSLSVTRACAHTLARTCPPHRWLSTLCFSVTCVGRSRGGAISSFPQHH